MPPLFLQYPSLILKPICWTLWHSANITANSIPRLSFRQFLHLLIPMETQKGLGAFCTGLSTHRGSFFTAQDPEVGRCPLDPHSLPSSFRIPQPFRSISAPHYHLPASQTLHAPPFTKEFRPASLSPHIATAVFMWEDLASP